MDLFCPAYLGILDKSRIIEKPNMMLYLPFNQRVFRLIGRSLHVMTNRMVRGTFPTNNSLNLTASENGASPSKFNATSSCFVNSNQPRHLRVGFSSHNFLFSHLFHTAKTQWRPPSKLPKTSKTCSLTLSKPHPNSSPPNQNTVLAPNPRQQEKQTPAPAAQTKQYVHLHRKDQIPTSPPSQRDYRVSSIRF